MASTNAAAATEIRGARASTVLRTAAGCSIRTTATVGGSSGTAMPGTTVLPIPAATSPSSRTSPGPRTRCRGRDPGPELVDSLELGGYRYLHSTRAELLRRLGRTTEARAAYTRAIELAATEPERLFLEHRRTGLG
ncbi:hypothetical protein NONO_c47260 [Nocardia nova SH22a]|uniref:RNA polymerase sigma factor n=1 Tax=Nocardia nova SH22a TaxID=1415166 RepID=W5TJI7_9NOCA|nr:hypothetical protein NONO_c47260 [Nocardia nova SH22a]